MIILHTTQRTDLPDEWLHQCRPAWLTNGRMACGICERPL